MNPIFPVTSHKHKVLSRLQHQRKGYYFCLKVLTCYPAITMSSIFGDYHDSSPYIAVAIVIVVFLIFLDETDNAVEPSFFHVKFSECDSIFSLFNDASQRIIVISNTEKTCAFELSLQVTHINKNICILGEIHQLHS
jgi:hypothetical protein